GATPEFNAVDASLWYVVAVHDYLQALGDAVDPAVRDRLRGAVEAILAGYAAGTRYGIRMDNDCLLAAGAPGVQLTWTDAKVDDWIVTPRVGKPVEVQALWLNALLVGVHLSSGGQADRWSQFVESGRASFRARFWNASGGYLQDVVDCDHRPGTVD